MINVKDVAHDIVTGDVLVSEGLDLERETKKYSYSDHTTG